MTLLEYITRHITILEDRSIALFAIGVMTALLVVPLLDPILDLLFRELEELGLAVKLEVNGKVGGVGSRWSCCS